MPQQSVLIVDGSPDSREVLRTALQRGGTLIFEAERAEQGLRLAQQHHPDLIVLNIEENSVDSNCDVSGFGKAAQANQASVVVLAGARRQAAEIPGGEFVAKPYHYGPLIRRIEQLLNSRSQAE